MIQKKCNKCFKNKEFTDFVCDSSKKGGYRNYCKDCRNVSLAIWRAKNRETLKASSQKWVKNNKGKRQASIKKYYEENKIEIIERSKEYVKQYRASEHGKLIRRILEEKRRKYINGTDDGTINIDSILALLRIQNFRCAITGKDISNNFHIDHKIPLSKNGKHIISNIQLLTPEANLSKSNKIYGNNIQALS